MGIYQPVRAIAVLAAVFNSMPTSPVFPESYLAAPGINETEEIPQESGTVLQRADRKLIDFIRRLPTDEAETFKADLMILVLSMRANSTLSFQQACRLMYIINQIEDNEQRPATGALLVAQELPEIEAFLERHALVTIDHYFDVKRKLLGMVPQMPLLETALGDNREEKGRFKKYLNNEQRVQIVMAALQGTSPEVIARELPQVVGDLSIMPIDRSVIYEFLYEQGEAILFFSELRAIGNVTLWATHAPDIYKIAADKIRRFAGTKNAVKKIRKVVFTIEKSNTPLARVVRDVTWYIENMQYPFDLGIALYSSIIASDQLHVSALADEVAAYFSTYVIPITRQPDKFMDCLLYLLGSENAGSIINERAATDLMVGIYRRLPANDAVQWAQSLSRFAQGLNSPIEARKQCAAKLYDAFTAAVFPRMKFCPSDTIAQLVRSMRWDKIMVPDDRKYDVRYLLEQQASYERKAVEAKRLFDYFFTITTVEALAIKWRIPEKYYGLIYEAVYDAAWNFDPSRGVKFKTQATNYVKRFYQYMDPVSSVEKKTLWFDEEGTAIVLTNMPSRERLPETAAADDYISSRIIKLYAVLDEHFSEEDRTIFMCACGLDPEFKNMELPDDAIPFVLRDRGLNPKLLSRQRIQQRVASITDRVIKLLNEPTVDDLIQWARFLINPFLGDRPPPLRRDTRAGGIPVIGDITLTGYPIASGKPVVVSVVRSDSFAGPACEHFIILDVSYHGETKGVTILRLNTQGHIMAQLRRNTVEEAVAFLHKLYDPEEFDRAKKLEMNSY